MVTIAGLYICITGVRRVYACSRWAPFEFAASNASSSSSATGRLEWVSYVSSENAAS